MKIIIDAGHGGIDGGGGTNQYWKEKDFALTISKYQYNRFKELGVDVAMTRTRDEYIAPAIRTKIVRESKANLCISNHINAGGGEGVETIHSIKNNGKLAKEIFDGIVSQGQKGRRAFSREGRSGDYYFMHRNTGSVTTIIVEYGFADNENDINRLLKNWRDYAEAVVKSVCNHYGIEYKKFNIDEIDNTKKVTEHWGKEYYDFLTEEKGMVIHEKRFDDTITRAEVFKVIALALGYKEKGE